MLLLARPILKKLIFKEIAAPQMKRSIFSREENDVYYNAMYNWNQIG